MFLTKKFVQSLLLILLGCGCEALTDGDQQVAFTCWLRWSQVLVWSTDYSKRRVPNSSSGRSNDIKLVYIMEGKKVLQTPMFQWSRGLRITRTTKLKCHSALFTSKIWVKCCKRLRHEVAFRKPIKWPYKRNLLTFQVNSWIFESFLYVADI